MDQQGPAPRRTVVLRAGRPVARARWGDRLAGVVGVLLLLLSVFLVGALPEEDVRTPQWRVAFADEAGPQQPSQQLDLEEGRSVDALFEVEHDNVHIVKVSVFVDGDDEPSSDPDGFTVELIGPDGDSVGEARQVETKPPRRKTPEETAEDPDNLYISEPVAHSFQFRLLDRPTDVVVDAASPDETLEEAQERLLPEYTLQTNGTWQVRVTLDEAGDCPLPGIDPDESSRGSYCYSRLPNGQDTGNPFTIGLFEYSYYTAEVVPLKE